MGYGCILLGEQTFNCHCWHNDTLSECWNDNQIWGYIICAGEELVEDTWEVNDPVLMNLVKMGIFDWRSLSDQLLPAALQAVHRGTTMASRIIPHLVMLEKKVYLH